MSELYTSLEKAKQEMNGGRPVVMTPLPESAQRIIDPAFVEGMGGLCEDEEMGLRCPVRGCGVWSHQLSQHIARSHRAIGGPAAVKEALGIPQRVGLLSAAARVSAVERGYRGAAARRTVVPVLRAAAKSRKPRRKRATVNERNFRNQCEAQIAQRILSLAEKVGRSPSQKEAELLDPSLWPAAYRVYGSWNAAKAACNLKTLHRHLGADDVVEAFSAFHAVHGHLPTSHQAARKAPMVPEFTTVLKHMQASSWAHAMMKVAIRLGIYDARYRPEPKQEEAA